MRNGYENLSNIFLSRCFFINFTIQYLNLTSCLLTKEKNTRRRREAFISLRLKKHQLLLSGLCSLFWFWRLFLWFGGLFEFDVFQFFFEDAACDKADFDILNDTRIDVFFFGDAFGFERNVEITELAQVHAVTFGEQRCQFLAQDGQNRLDIRLANGGRMASNIIGEFGQVDAASFRFAGIILWRIGEKLADFVFVRLYRGGIDGDFRKIA